MQIIGDLFSTIFFQPIANLLVFIFGILQALQIPGAFGLSIILLTVVIRLLVWPFMSAQLKSVKKMAELKPHLDALKTKHKNDRQSFAAAQMALFKEHNYNPAAGCLPSLLQLPIIWALFQTISSFMNGDSLDKINQILYPFIGNLKTAPDLNFFGMNLTVKPAEFTTLGIWLLIIPLLTVFLQFIQSKMMALKSVKNYPSDSPKEKKEKEGLEDSMAAMQSQMVYMMPLMVGVFAFQFPIGIALYWNTFTVLGIVQQYFLSGWGGLESWIRVVKR